MVEVGCLPPQTESQSSLTLLFGLAIGHPTINYVQVVVIAHELMSADPSGAAR
jgi:hypothetical protein